MSKIWKIYKHTLLVGENAGWSYVGQTNQVNPQARWRYNGNGYKHSWFFWKAICDFGWQNFSHEILEDNILTQELANKREQYWISYYHTFIEDPMYAGGYNLTSGGEKSEISEITRQKLITSHIGQVPWNKGKTNVYSEETKSQISRSLKGRKQPEELIKKRAAAHIGLKHPHSEETKQKIREKIQGRVWITNGASEKQINKEDINIYLNCGWHLGRKERIIKNNG